MLVLPTPSGGQSYQRSAQVRRGDAFSAYLEWGTIPPTERTSTDGGYYNPIKFDITA